MWSTELGIDPYQSGEIDLRVLLREMGSDGASEKPTSASSV
ncbi:MAG: hypothetical protein VYA45_02500 [Candidatus Thermoplasmatota archaeon]|nr:hypothetical protein [Candidatus Thermoplasmatota archaeon]